MCGGNAISSDNGNGNIYDSLYGGNVVAHVDDVSNIRDAAGAALLLLL